MPTLTTLVTFNGTDGSEPYAGLTIDSAGNLYGTTYQGGSGFGTVYQVIHTGGGIYATSPTTLVAFDGVGLAYPYYGSLTIDAEGDLLGTTLSGGFGFGAVYEVTHIGGGSYSSNPTTLASFSGPDGISPIAGMVIDADRNLFSMTYVGGANSLGTVFELAYSGGGYASTPVTLVSFDGPNGKQPTANLTIDADGNLFGTTFYGGAFDKGTVFKLANNGDGSYTHTVLVSFDGLNGQGTYSSVIADGDGNLFGTTYVGGANGRGTVFQLVNNGGSYTLDTLVDFDGTNGANPVGNLLIDASGSLFGTTFYGGANDAGTVFEIDYSGGGYATTPIILASFDGTNNANPTSGLIADADGDLFGTTNFTSSGGNGHGTVYTLTDTGFQVICYLRGTMIATPTGEVPVEGLSIGDTVQTYGGATQQITWIGTGRVLATRGARSVATPVIVRKGALADNVPDRDLHVTKGHSLYLDDVLIPVEFLINHRSIVWDDRAQEVEIYHVELATHDVLLANGAPAESYRDDGNRWLFRNANTGWGQPPKQPFAPVLTGGPVVDAVWRRLLDRSGTRLIVPTTEEHDLHLLVDGKRVDGKVRQHGIYQFRLPPHATEIRLASRAGVQAELGRARDPRPLGVAVRQIRLWHGAHLRLIEASDSSLGEGFHLFEEKNGFRWTDGNALLPAALYDGIDTSFELDIHIACTTHYPLNEVEASAAA